MVSLNILKPICDLPSPPPRWVTLYTDRHPDRLTDGDYIKRVVTALRDHTLDNGLPVYPQVISVGLYVMSA